MFQKFILNRIQNHDDQNSLPMLMKSEPPKFIQGNLSNEEEKEAPEVDNSKNAFNFDFDK